MALKKIGGLWLKEGPKGKFMSGEIDREEGGTMKIMVFKNQYKSEGLNRPDYTINLVTDDTPPADGNP